MITAIILGLLSIPVIIVRNKKKKEEKVITDEFFLLDQKYKNIRHGNISRTLHFDLLEKFGLSREVRLTQKVNPNFETVLNKKIKDNKLSLDEKAREEKRLKSLLSDCLKKEAELERQNLIKKKKKEEEEETLRRAAYASSYSASDYSSSNSSSSSSNSGWSGGGGDSSGGGSSDSW